MAWTDNTLIGLTGNDERYVRVRNFNQKWYVVEIINEIDNTFYVRGREFLMSGNVSFEPEFGQLDQTLYYDLESSDSQGLTQPTSFLMPSGYEQKYDTNQKPYVAEILSQTLYDGNIIGISDGKDIQVRFINEQWWLFIIKPDDTDAFYVLGTNYLDENYIQWEDRPLNHFQRALLNPSDTPLGGTATPQSFIAPLGYIKLTDNEGKTFYKQQSNMALIDKQQIGTLYNYPLQTRQINGSWWIVMIDSPSPDAFFVRGTNILNHPQIVLTVALSNEDKAQLAGGVTNYEGLDEPETFTTPSGYTKKTKPDGAKYYEQNASTISTPSGAVVEVVTPPTKGTLVIQPNGIYNYTPNSGATGFDSATYRFRFSDNSVSSIATISFSITAQNQTPAPTTNRGTIEPNGIFTVFPPSGYTSGVCRIYKNGGTSPVANIPNATGSISFEALSSSNTDYFEATWQASGISESPRSRRINVRFKPQPVNDTVSVGFNTAVSGSVTLNDSYAENLGFW